MTALDLATVTGGRSHRTLVLHFVESGSRSERLRIDCSWTLAENDSFLAVNLFDMVLFGFVRESPGRHLDY